MPIEKLTDLTPDPENANAGTARGLSAVEESLQKFGAGRSILTDRDGVVIAGNKTHERAVDLGLKARIIETDGNELVVVVRKDLSLKDDPAKARGLAYADNRAGELGLSWNPDQIRRDLDEGLVLPPVFFTEGELATIFGEPAPPRQKGKTDPDDVPETPKTLIARGQVYQLGRHFVMCGDCTDLHDVAALMQGAKASVVFTSPPYAQQRDYGQPIENWDALMQGMCAALPVTDNAQVLINLGLVHGKGEWSPYFLPWLDWMQKQGWRRFGWYVWDQGFGLPGDWNGRLAPSFEFVFHFNHHTVKPDKWVPKHKENIKALSPEHTMLRDPGDAVHPADNLTASLQTHKIPDSVIRITRHTGSVQVGKEKADHPAVFPVELPMFFYRTYAAQPGTVVYEPFGGSGSALIAAEQMELTAHVMDIEPRYVQLIVDRWEAFTEKKAERIV